MKVWPIFRAFFVFVGIITTVCAVLLILGYAYLSQTGQLKNLPNPTMLRSLYQATNNSNNPSAAKPYDHPLLTPEQERLAESFGINTQTLPTQLTPAIEQCAIVALGAERVSVIKGGATPTVSDILQAKHCFQ